MGLGDVKLMAAGGVWLGLEGAITALCVGAFAGLLHGIFVLLYARMRHGRSESFRDMTIPAGPGFCIGLAAVGAWVVWDSIPLFGGM